MRLYWGVDEARLRTLKKKKLNKWRGMHVHRGLPGCAVVKNLPAKAEEAGDVGSIPVRKIP